jgi:hypothetical protein
MAEREESERAEARRSWPVRKYRLGEEPCEDLSATTTAEERLRMMWPLALGAWSLSGRPLPDYPREKTPIRVLRRAKDQPR